MPAPIQCGNCTTEVPPGYFNVDHLTPCPKCSCDMQVFVFPALFRLAAAVGPSSADATDATCFYHPDNRAAAPCASCGRFLCTVCETELGSEILCPKCIHAGVTSRKLVRLENRRILYDNVAFAVATGPFLLIWPTLITAPMAIFLSIRYWNTPSSIVKRTKVRFILAILIALLEIAMWGFVAYVLSVMPRVNTGVK
jgi:hypothetical protein